MSPSVEFATPLVLPCGLTIKNRFFKSAMSEQLGDRNHDPLPELATLYTTWAAGGVGLAVTGNVMIDRGALGEVRNVVLDGQSDLAAFERWAEAGRRYFSHLFVQLNHPGKQSPRFVSKEPVAPSAIPLGGDIAHGFKAPRALTEREIVEIIGRFATAARLARQAGFSGVQIHSSHGYLVSQFLSPRANQRGDAWGGSPERRRRFLLDVYGAVRAEVGTSYPIAIKLNSADFLADGLSEDESLAAAGALASAGIDLIEVSGGTYEAPVMTEGAGKTGAGEAYFIEYAERLRKRVGVPIVLTGGFRSGPAMSRALASGATDMIGLARPLAIYPDLPNRLLADPTTSITLPHPSTHVGVIDRYTALGLTWYEAQIARIARGLPPRPDLSAWSAIALFLKRSGTRGKARVPVAKVDARPSSATHP